MGSNISAANDNEVCTTVAEYQSRTKIELYYP